MAWQLDEFYVALDLCNSVLFSVTFSIVVWGERNKKASALPLIFYLYLATCCVLVHSLIDFHFNCSAKNELDMEEFMFFLTGGVGLENKVLNLKLTSLFAGLTLMAVLYLT